MIPSQVSAALATEVWNAKDTPHPPLLAKGEWRKRAFSVNKYESLNSPSECKGLHREEEEEEEGKKKSGRLYLLSSWQNFEKNKKNKKKKRFKWKKVAGGLDKNADFLFVKSRSPRPRGGLS